MLKSLAVLGVLLAITQAPVPATGHASDQPATNSKYSDGSPDKGAQPAAPTLPIPAQDKSGNSLESEHTKNSNSDEQSAVNISSSAPMSVWTWHEIIAWAFGLITTPFLVWGVIVARQTLRVIAEQTKQTTRAAKAAEDAVTASNKSLVLQEKTAKQELRAYMTLRRGKLFILDGGDLSLKLEIENSGQTPAYDFQGVFRYGISVYPRKDSWEPNPTPQSSKGIVGPNRAFYAGGEIAMPQRVIEDLRLNKNLVAYITGRYTYRDIFKDTHYLRMQVVIGGPMGIQIETDETGKRFYVLITDIEGNEAD